MSTYTRWYRDGSVSVTKNSNAVVGTNTYWLTAGLNPGDIFKVDGVDYEIVSITDNTHLTIAGNYAGTTGTGKSYAIVRNFTATTLPRIASQTAELLGDFSKYIDADMQSIHGKSAYQIACDNGYVGTEAEWVQSLTAYGVAKSQGYTGTLAQWLASLKGDSAYTVAVNNGYSGTEAQWLESLKADNEWSTLDARTSGLDLTDVANYAGRRNSIFRGKNLGEFTADHLAALRASRFEDFYVGDYFTHANGKVDMIAKIFPSTNGDNLVRDIMLIRMQPLSVADGYIASYNRRPSGTEGEEDYDAGTLGCYYAESSWYTVDRPKFIEEIEALYGADNVRSFPITVPSSYSGTKPSSWVYLYSKAHLPTLSMLGLPYFTIDDLTYQVAVNNAGDLALPLFQRSQQWSWTHLGRGHNWTYVLGAAESMPLSTGRVWTAGLNLAKLRGCVEYFTGTTGQGFAALLCPIFCVG